MTNYRNRILLTVVLFLLFIANLYPQENSLAFKKNRPVKNNPYFYRPDLSYQLFQQFRLLQQANAGDALAQHELGLRLLLGEGMPADTLKAVEWIRRAADQNLSAACYNYGIMLINGIGVDWNPFEAFSYFRKAALKGMPQAQYVTGILYTDNLTLPRNWNKAYYWIYKSKENGFDVEKDILEELKSKVSLSFLDSLKSGKYNEYIKSPQDNFSDNSDHKTNSQTEVEKSLGLSYIDFEALEDTSKYSVKDIDLIKDLLRTEIPNIIDTLKLSSSSSLSDIKDQNQVNYLLELCNFGSPEALTLVGRLYEKGIYFKKNILSAAEYYIRAIRYESFRAPFLLNDLYQNTNLRVSAEDGIKMQDATSMFVWYGLSRFGYQNDIIFNESIKLLKSAASLNHISSINELALLFFTGDIVEKDDNKAEDLWKRAEKLGSAEATIRLVLKEIFQPDTRTLERKYISSLLNFSAKGSVLAQAALGYCYLNGISILPNEGLAAKYFRLAAYRGNRFSYQQLKNLYDKKRPDLSEFKLSN